jgi:hypothetical protein
MADKRELLALIATLEDILRQIEAISTRDDEGRKFDLVQLRKSLTVIIGKLSDAGSSLLSPHPDRSLHEGFRTRLNSMRHAVALHQSNFPAASLGQNPTEYRNSAMAITKINRDFIDWSKSTLAILKEKPD